FSFGHSLKDFRIAVFQEAQYDPPGLNPVGADDLYDRSTGSIQHRRQWQRGPAASAHLNGRLAEHPDADARVGANENPDLSELRCWIHRRRNQPHLAGYRPDADDLDRGGQIMR